MRFGRVVQTKGLGSALASEMKRSMAISSSATDRNTPRLRRLLVSLAKKPSTAIEPGGGSRREVEGPARVFCEPFLDFWMLVGGVIVDDRMDRLSLGNLRVDLTEEADELLMPMTLHVAADDGAIENIERGEQCGRAVALVVVGHRPSPPRFHRQSWLSAVEGLDLAFFVNREDDRVGGRIDVETDHVPEFLSELRIVRKLERPDTVRHELVGLEDALHRSQADPHRLGQHPARPLGSLARR